MNWPFIVSSPNVPKNDFIIPSLYIWEVEMNMKTLISIHT